MHQEYFYVRPQDVAGHELIFTQEENHHLSNVLRKKKGDVVWAVDGEGAAYEVKLLYLAKNEVRGKILQVRRRIGEPVTEVTLAQGILKGDRFDWLVEKATEIGVRKIIPVTTELSVGSGGQQKTERWQRIALAAMKQSGRTYLPEITESRTLKQVLPLGINCKYRYVAVAGTDSKPFRLSEHDGMITSTKALLLVGPEGGFTSDEIHSSKEHGFQAITLGPRRLRSETAGIVLSVLLLSQLGEMS